MAPAPLLLLNSTTCVGILLELMLPIKLAKAQCAVINAGGLMTVTFRFADKWVRWYRVLRYAKAFSLFDSVRYGLWLARG